MFVKVIRFVLLMIVCVSKLNFVTAQTPTAYFDTIYFCSIKENNQPLAYNFLDENDTALHVYTTLKHVIPSKKYSLKYRLFKEVKKGIKVADIFQYSSSFTQKDSQFLFVKTIPINDTFVQSGNYKVMVSLYNYKDSLMESKLLDCQFLRKPNDFFKGQPQQVLDYTNVKNIEQTFVNKYTIADLKKNIKSLTPISSAIEDKIILAIDQYDSLFFLRQFFFNFWKNRNELYPEAEWKTYVDKLNYVSDKFGGSALKGYETDRGKIYMKHSAPDRIERRTSEKSALPYEIWYYLSFERKDNVYFLFYQAGSMGKDMEILHCTVPEIYFDPYWKEKLFSDGSTQQQNNNHRAFDYFK
jgi:GWxTD domain-containing protein